MKPLLALFLCATLLSACSKTPEETTTAASLPVNQDLELYIIPADGTKGQDVIGHPNPKVLTTTMTMSFGAQRQGRTAYTVTLAFLGTRDGADHYRIVVNDGTRSTEQETVYSGTSVEAFRDDEYLVGLRPRP